MTKSILYAALVAVPLIAVIVQAQSADSPPPAAPAENPYAGPSGAVLAAPGTPYAAPAQPPSPTPVYASPAQASAWWGVPHSEPEPAGSVVIRRMVDGKPVYESRAIATDTIVSQKLDAERRGLLDGQRQLDQQVAELVSQYKSMRQEEEKTRATNQLFKYVSEQFKLRQLMREKELEDLTSRLETLRELQEQRNVQSIQIINDRVQQLLRDADGLGWDAAPGGGENAFFFQSTDAAPVGPPRPSFGAPIIQPFSMPTPAWNGQPSTEMKQWSDATQKAKAAADAARRASEDPRRAVERAFKKSMENNQGLSRETLEAIRKEAMTAVEKTRREAMKAQRDAIEAAKAEADAMAKAQSALAQAQELASQGKFAEALELHRWIHDHSLEQNPHFSAVRLSFALSAWEELGRKYPPAKSALIAVRDEGEKKIRDGNGTFELFQEVAAINGTLNQQAKTVELFKWIDKNDSKLAKSCYFVADRDLVDQGELKLASRFLEDPQAAVALIFHRRELEARTTANRPELQRLAQKRADEDIARIIKILDGGGRSAEVAEVEAEVREEAGQAAEDATRAAEKAEQDAAEK